jgi:hypothetical protein
MLYRLWSAVIFVLIFISGGAFAQDLAMPAAPTVSPAPDFSDVLDGPLPVDANLFSPSPLFLSDAGQTPLAIHGYMETQVKTEHITPRGLIIADRGVEVQPAAGLTFDLYDGQGFLNNISTTFGVWNSVNSSLHIPSAGSWFEIDYLARVNVLLADRVNLTLQYVAFDSPGNQFSTDNNIEFTAMYNDTGYLAKDFGVRPYAKLFYNISGSSTTLLGRNGSSYDVELGATPTYIWRAIDNYPITLSLPTYVTVGPKNFWGGNENVGLFTTALAASVPLNFIPPRFGRWHVDASVAYFDLLNGKLVDAAQALGNGRDRSRVVGEIGIGLDF